MRTKTRHGTVDNLDVTSVFAIKTFDQEITGIVWWETDSLLHQQSTDQTGERLDSRAGKCRPVFPLVHSDEEDMSLCRHVVGKRICQCRVSLGTSHRDHSTGQIHWKRGTSYTSRVAEEMADFIKYGSSKIDVPFHR